MRVLIVDDHAVVRQGIKQILLGMNEPVTVGEAGDGDEALSLLQDVWWDMVLLDIGLPGLNGIEVLKQIKSKRKEMPVLMLSMYPEDQYARRALQAGAAGYLTKESAPEDLLNAINKVRRGERHISADMARRLINEFDERVEKAPHQELSDREFEVLRLIASGLTASEIAEKLSLSVKTVSTYRTRILKKMKMKHNAELTHYAIKYGLVD